MRFKINHERLRELRDRTKLNQKQVAAQLESLGIKGLGSQSTLCMLEKGGRDTTMPVIIALARFYGVTVEWLMDCGAGVAAAPLGLGLELIPVTVVEQETGAKPELSAAQAPTPRLPLALREMPPPPVFDSDTGNWSDEDDDGDEPDDRDESGGEDDDRSFEVEDDYVSPAGYPDALEEADAAREASGEFNYFDNLAAEDKQEESMKTVNEPAEPRDTEGAAPAGQDPKPHLPEKIEHLADIGQIYHYKGKEVVPSQSFAKFVGTSVMRVNEAITRHEKEKRLPEAWHFKLTHGQAKMFCDIADCDIKVDEIKKGLRLLTLEACHILVAYFKSQNAKQMHREGAHRAAASQRQEAAGVDLAAVIRGGNEQTRAAIREGADETRAMFRETLRGMGDIVSMAIITAMGAAQARPADVKRAVDETILARTAEGVPETHITFKTIAYGNKKERAWYPGVDHNVIAEMLDNYKHPRDNFEIENHAGELRTTRCCRRLGLSEALAVIHGTVTFDRPTSERYYFSSPLHRGKFVVSKDSMDRPEVFRLFGRLLPDDVRDEHLQTAGAREEARQLELQGNRATVTPIRRPGNPDV